MKSKYQVKIERSSFDQLYLLVTHNGTQWDSIRIDNTEHEIPELIKVLNEYLGKSLSKIDLNNGTETPEMSL